MENQKSLVLLSSEVMISEESKLHPVFLSVQFLLASNEGNANKEGVTKAFIDDLIGRKEIFECLPMYVDMKRLLSGDYDNLGHLYSRATKTFGTQQFGSLTNFYSETDEYGVTSLYAEARFPKRELEACMRLVELYELGKLCVSVELRYNPEHTIIKDGVKFIDAHEDNALTGMCIVSHPAEHRAVALSLVAEKNTDDPRHIITEGEEPTNRGETETMEKENMTADVIEEAAEAVSEDVHSETETAEEQPVVIAEGEGASDGEGGGASDGEGGGASDGEGAGASDGEDDDGESDDTDPVDAVIDPDDEQKTTAETQEANAEVLEHSVDVHEAIHQCPETGETIHVTEMTERVVETMDDPETVIAQQKETIEKLTAQVAELEQIKAQYDKIVAEREANALAEKRAKAKAFAEKQGLNTEDTIVAEAIMALDYAKIAEISMAEEQEETEEQPAEQTITLASFVELDVSNDNKYGGLLSRKKE